MNDANPPSESGLIRLQTYLSRAGIASRRHAEEMIRAGRVAVNGVVVQEMGRRIDPARDEVRLDEAPVSGKDDLHYYALHKPAGIVSAVSDPRGRPTVTSLVPSQVRLYPVGRLDLDSEGLLLLTNDGELALRLSHPRFQQDKEYHALVRGVPDQESLQRLASGLVLDDGPTLPARATLLEAVGGRAWVSVTLREGQKRQVRRMLAAIGHEVRRLVRVRIGPILLGDLESGASRRLTARELRTLKAIGR